MTTAPRCRYRTIWLADAHLGGASCRAEALLGFLRATESEHLYLVGNMVDRRTDQWQWTDVHTAVVQEVLRKVQGGTRVVYLPGDCDTFVSAARHLSLGAITVQAHAMHTMTDGRQLLVVHGDTYDWLAPCVRAVRAVRPSWAQQLDRWRRRARGGSALTGYEATLVREARAWDLDGVVCGYQRAPALRTTTGVLYASAGDWVEHCAALVEHVDGTLEHACWSAERSCVASFGTMYAVKGRASGLVAGPST